MQSTVNAITCAQAGRFGQYSLIHAMTDGTGRLWLIYATGINRPSAAFAAVTLSPDGHHLYAHGVTRHGDGTFTLHGV